MGRGETKHAGLKIDSKTTVGDYLEFWLDHLNVRPNTERSYRSIVKNHLMSGLGEILLTRLSPAQVQAFYSSAKAKSGSQRNRQLMHAVLHRALEQAVQWEYLDKNPCKAVQKPKSPPKKKMAALTPAQVQAFLAAARSDRLHALYYVALHTGLRQGELLGLQWGNINFAAGTINVQHTLIEDRGKHFLADPKTDAGRRSVALSPKLVKVLQEHKANMDLEGHKSDWVFCDSQGGPLRKSNFSRRSFKPLLTTAKLPDIRFHDLRHTAATLMLAQRENPKIVQERLGHSKISVTLDIYSHAIPSMQSDAAIRLDEFFPE